MSSVEIFFIFVALVCGLIGYHLMGRVIDYFNPNSQRNQPPQEFDVVEPEILPKQPTDSSDADVRKKQQADYEAFLEAEKARKKS